MNLRELNEVKNTLVEKEQVLIQMYIDTVEGEIQEAINQEYILNYWNLKRINRRIVLLKNQG